MDNDDVNILWVNNCEECKINNIKGLLINVDEGNFKMTIEKSKKNKTSNKSKSNIDRFIKR